MFYFVILQSGEDWRFHKKETGRRGRQWEENNSCVKREGGRKKWTKGGSAVKSPGTSVYFHPSRRLTDISNVSTAATASSMCTLTLLPTRQNYHIVTKI